MYESYFPVLNERKVHLYGIDSLHENTFQISSDANRIYNTFILPVINNILDNDILSKQNMSSIRLSDVPGIYNSDILIGNITSSWLKKRMAREGLLGKEMRKSFHASDLFGVGPEGFGF